jgi:hypothetical protein
MRYKLVIGLAKVDQEKYPDVKDFDTALDEAVTQCFMPIFSTFRIIRVESNMMFIVIAESITEPEFIGGGK